MNISGNRLSVDFENMPLSAVINDIGVKTGIQFKFLGGAAAAGYDSPFSLKFDSLPIHSALKKLLMNFNCSFISDSNDNIQQVFILGSKSAAGSGQRNQTPSFQAAKNDAGSGEGASENPPGMEEGVIVPSGTEKMYIENPNEAAALLIPPGTAYLNRTSTGAGGVAANVKGARANPATLGRRPGRWSERKPNPP